MPTALLAAFAFLKNSAKHHKCFKGGSFKILLIWRVQAYHSDKKGHPVQDTLSDHTISYCASSHRTNMTFHFRIQVLYTLQGLWFFPQCGKGEMKRGALQVAGYCVI